MRRIGIIGSTGSIGTQTLEVIKELNSEGQFSFEVTALSAGNNAKLLAEQAREFGVKLLCIDTEEGAQYLKEALKDLNPEILVGEEGLCALASSPMDVLVTAIVGMRGIKPTLAAIAEGTEIALANKETLVAAGEVVMAEAKRRNVRILPVDSEHSAILQCLQGEKRAEVDKIILTASGGPFRTMPEKDLEKVTAEDALKHPTWNMGGKITIDCASLMNKGLEVIEAKWLYDASYDDIDVVVHPQSIIHSMVKYRDGSVIAQLGNPTMKLPIQYALTYPSRVVSTVKPLDLSEIGTLTFEKPDTERFPCLKLAYEAGRTGGTLPAAMNAANEAAVALFFKGKIGFSQISRTVEKAMASHKTIYTPTAEEILAVSNETYNKVFKDAAV
ncbi:MAG: 1-deoxy-D-xylulose-5-phosphate reductoisomerase [Clostridia bacterium]|nr:1-deoxy-D-xylulose-5-phosphate reductoisomerase [Clostridia bacterium]